MMIGASVMAVILRAPSRLRACPVADAFATPEEVTPTVSSSDPAGTEAGRSVS